MTTPQSTVSTTPAAIDHPFILDSITETDSPMHPGEAEWHRYVINQGTNQIVGYRRGALKNVRAEVDEIVLQLNARRTIKPGRKHITITPVNKRA